MTFEVASSKSACQLLVDAFRNGSIPLDLDLDSVLDDFGGSTPLHVAVMASNVAVLEEILSRVLDINVRNRVGKTALAVAVAHDDRDSVDCLLAHGALLNTRDHNKMSPLHDAIRSHKTEMALRLIAAGADVDEVATGNHTLLHVASASTSDELATTIIPALLDAGANIQDAIKPGFCQVGSTRIKVDRMRLFLAHGARFADMPPIHNQTMVANPAYVQLYLEQGGNPNKQDSPSVEPLLTTALRKCSLEAVELLAPVADVNFTEQPPAYVYRHATLLHTCDPWVQVAPLGQAIWHNLDTSLLKQLLDHASAQPPSYYANALKMALHCKSASNVAMLASKVDLTSECFLLDAVQNPDYVTLLLTLGADANRRDQHGRPPLLGACQPLFEASARILLPHTTNSIVRDGFPPLFESVATYGLRGLARDLARTVLPPAPTTTMSQFYWQPCLERDGRLMPASDWGWLPQGVNASAYSKLELEYMAALCTLLDKPFWWTKETLPSLPPGVSICDTDIIHGELQVIRDEFVRPLGLVPNTTRGVYHADDALSVDLLSSLSQLLTPLEVDASWDDNVLEVVDPAMHGAVYGQSRFNLHPHNMRVGTSTSATVQHEMPPSTTLTDAACPHLQMLPTPVTWDASLRQVTLESYINNIHPSQSALYAVLAETLSTVLPLLDAARWVPRKDSRRIRLGGGHENELRLLRDAYLKHHGLDPSTTVLQKTLRAFKKTQGPITSQLQPAPPTLDAVKRFWKDYVPRFDDDDGSWRLPSKPQSHQVLCHVQCLRATPEAPAMTTVWRRGSGATNEAVQFTAVALYGADNVSLRIEFRETYEKADFGPHKRNPAIEVLLSDSIAERVSQDTGFVTLRPGRLLLIRSSAAYRIHLQSGNSSREGVAKLLSWSFVRPTRFASLPYLQRYPHPTTKLPHHALFVSPRVYDRALALHLSIVEGDVALVQRWLRWDPSLCTAATLELAAAASQGPILRLLLDQFPALATAKMMDLVAMAGDLALLIWLHEAGAVCTSAAMDGAAMNGHGDIVAFLHSARTEGCTIAAATAAAVHGHASIVRFLLERRTEGVQPSLRFEVPHGEHTTHSVSGNTYLEVVDLVAASVKLTDAAFKVIVEKAGLAALQHVHTCGYLKKMTKPLLELAVTKQDHEMLRYVLDCIDQENPRAPSDVEWLPPDAPYEHVSMRSLRDGPSPFDRWEHCKVMELAALNGDMTSLKLLHKSRLRVGSSRAIVYAAYRGHMDVLEWLHKHRRDDCDQDAMALAAARGHYDVVRWLHEVYGLWRTHAALATAAYTGHLPMVTYLLDVPTGGVDTWTDSSDENSGLGAILPDRDGDLGGFYSDYVRGSAAYWAASQGHLEILQLLVARGHEVPSTATNEAVENGHLHTVRYLHEEFDQRCSRRSIVDAVVKHHVDVVAYVLSHHCWQLASSVLVDDRSEISLHMLLVATARSGRLDILELVGGAFPVHLPTELPRRVSERMMIRAASYGHLDMLHHLHTVCGFGWTSVVQEAAIRRGRKKVLRYLSTLGPADTSVYDVDDRGLWREMSDFIVSMTVVDGQWRAQPMYID
ncbi:hypothetical protein SDRG_08921 [Saprolegnia diclina VS20]|uniref:DUF4246 domain-containing protein n=1 Tax=Saprolegnia diclina (strain VS20) TaxID=1156394 RepID=T0QFB8_SAPDV|nr:hypothetical protein SDRG_08921 [Saprolegnia diclina VS20]EQC33406.1 hypothetical protein SDRG_08921 [Saprolegnia diclina VS20]|eukprot:XP_008613046.1 hypothetical protein SDRG_08921 [Saprolegnia diclina VS20]